MIVLRVKGWKDFQHYKDRSPPWIKLHKGLLDNYEYQRLPLASRALAPMLWLLASESDDGAIEYDAEKIAFRIRTTAKEIIEALKPLIDAGFLLVDGDASAVLAGCNSDAMPETETYKPEEEVEVDIPAAPQPKRSKKPRNEYPEDFEAAFAGYPRKGDTNKSAAFKAWTARLKSGETVEEMTAGVCRYAAYCEASSAENRFIKQPETFFGADRHYLNAWTVPPKAKPTIHDERKAVVDALTGRDKKPADLPFFDGEARRVAG